MKILDAQVHVYERDHPGRPWAQVLHGPPEVTGDQMVAAMDEAGVDGAIIVSVYTMYRYDPSYAIEVWRAHPGRFSLVRPFDPSDPSVSDQIDEWASIDGSVGIRLMSYALGDLGVDHVGVNAMVRQAIRHRLAVNVVGSSHLELYGQLAERYPDAQFVIDHMALAQPLEPPPPPDPWAGLDKVLPLARYPNIAIKLSNACTLAHEPFPYRDIWDPLWRIFDSFGFERCMWGTDWTRATGMLTYKQAVDAFLVTDRLSDGERELIMGGSLARIYRWST